MYKFSNLLKRIFGHFFKKVINYFKAEAKQPPSVADDIKINSPKLEETIYKYLTTRKFLSHECALFVVKYLKFHNLLNSPLIDYYTSGAMNSYAQIKSENLSINSSFSWVELVNAQRQQKQQLINNHILKI